MTHSPAPAFAHTSGPRSAKLLIVGEAWGESEDIIKKPFAGSSGQLLFEMLGEALPHEFPELHAEATRMFRYGLAWVRPRDAWLEATGIAFTNVLAFRPRDNKMENLCCDKKTAEGLMSGYPYSPSSKGRYLEPQYFGELARLREEITQIRPNLLLALGNTATWATLHATNIGSIRGSITESAQGSPAGPDVAVKCLPTYHPAGVLRQWSWRPIVVADFIKAWRESQFPEVRRPRRAIHISPTLVELEARVKDLLTNPPPLLSVDIETGAGQIKCIGFSGSRNAAMIVPFCEPNKWTHFWSPGEEARAWQLVKLVLESDIPKLGQNFLYDLQYILKLGIRPKACLQDTMLLHHSHFPEMQKGLGFLGSIYTNEASWKLMARQKKIAVKRDE